MNSHKDYTANIAARVSGKGSVFFLLFFLFSKINFPRNRSGQIPTMEAAGSSDRKVSCGCSTAPAPRQWHESFEISGGKIWQMVPQIFIWCTWTNIVNFWWNHKQLSSWLNFIILALNACFKLVKQVLIVTNFKCTCVFISMIDRLYLSCCRRFPGQLWIW